MFGIDDAIAAGLQVFDKFIPDPQAKAEAEAALRESLQKWDAAQTEVNKIEAGNSNVFVSGWRPFIGWTCGAAFAYHFVLQPLLVFILASFGVDFTLPVFSMESLMTVLMGLLGMGGLRTYEKFKGVASK
jgi:hypothetical protein